MSIRFSQTYLIGVMVLNPMRSEAMLRRGD
jgi:hypothetical protein